MCSKVSVAIATYNGAKYFEKQLDSIVSQTLEVNEIVICDDNSHDETYEIARKYKKNYSKIDWCILKNNSNLGYSKNFRRAITNCTGDIIFLCDQDDIWSKDKVKKIVEVFENNRNVLSLITDFRNINSNDDFFYEEDKSNNIWVNSRISSSQNKLEKIYLTEILGHNFGPGCTQAIRKDLLAPYSKIKSNMVHDWMLNIVAAFNDGCYYYKENLTYYRIHENNAIGMTVLYNKKRIFLTKIKNFFTAFYFDFFRYYPDYSKDISLNLYSKSLVMIEDVVGCKKADDKLALDNYHKFENQYIDNLSNKKLISYLCSRIKYRDCYKNQIHVQNSNEWNLRKMHDFAVILKKK